ncbi:hypothetical protein evm_008101 [Chilo suppressalis]|nr:hypothetical protein evm_008101 [Chilo suppressalis]
MNKCPPPYCKTDHNVSQAIQHSAVRWGLLAHTGAPIREKNPLCSLLNKVHGFGTHLQKKVSTGKESGLADHRVAVVERYMFLPHELRNWIPLGISSVEYQTQLKTLVTMKVMQKLQTLRKEIEVKFQEQFGFKLQDATFTKIVAYLHEPKDASSLAVTRILFGLAMLFDIPDERGGATMERRWGDPTTCHFPLLPLLQPVPMPYMALVYAAMWIGAAGIMLGYKYSISSTMFTLCYWYLLLIEKSFWNNHSYLFGLVALLLTFTDAACYWLFLTVPQIDYLVVHWFIFAFDLTVALWMMWGRTRHVSMLFCALFHLMNSRLFRIGMFPWVCLATMPLFYPFDWPKLIGKFVSKHSNSLRNKICSNIPQCAKEFQCETDHSRMDVYDECSCFDEIPEDQNIINDESLEQTDNETQEDGGHENEGNNKDLVQAFLGGNDKKCIFREKKEKSTLELEHSNESDTAKNFTVYMIIFHIVTQLFLPFSHFITKGYNNWTDGLYGYSWDMMVHTWESHSTIIKVVDNERHHEFYVDPSLFTPNDRWTRHGDMVNQYAHCLKNNILDTNKKSNNRKISENISIYVDVWSSMNGRFAQRMFDPKVDMLKAKWTPFEAVSYLMPVLDEALSWRTILDEIREEVHTWNNYSDVSFFADFPEYAQEKFIPEELQNVTLIVLQGIIAYEPELSALFNGQTTKLETGDSIHIEPGTFHKVLNIGESYAYYMYTFINSTEMAVGNKNNVLKPKLPIGSELARRFSNMIKFGSLIIKSILQLFLRMSTCQQ